MTKREHTKERLWHLAKRAAPFVLVGGLILYVLARPNAGQAGEEIPAYAVMAMTPDSQEPQSRLTIGRARTARFALVLRPSKAREQVERDAIQQKSEGKSERKPVVAYVFASSAGELEPNAVDAKVDVGGDGVIHIAGGARSLEGASELRVVIGAPSAFAKFDDAAAHAKSGKSDAFVQVKVLPIDRE